MNNAKSVLIGSKTCIGVVAFEDGGAHEPALHAVCEDEIDGGKNPEVHIVGMNLRQRRAVGVHAYEPFHSPCGRYAGAQPFPEWSHGIARPCKPRKEEKHY